MRKHTEKLEKISIFPAPPISRPYVFCLQVLTRNVLCFGNSSSKKGFVRSENSGLPQNGSRKMASENISAHDDRNDLTGNRRPCPPADLLKPLPNCDSKNGALRATEPFKQKTVFYCNSREKYRREWF